jgi:hypothetical protein
MAKKKKKSFWKKAAKAALIGGALYAGAKGLGKRKLSKSVSGMDDAGRGVKWFGHRLDKIPRSDPTTVAPDFSLGASAAKGGRIGKKHGGRTGKQFGGGLNRPIARPIGGVAGPVGGVGAPVRPLAYKHGGKVKSMGIAKRGGGVAKK